MVIEDRVVIEDDEVTQRALMLRVGLVGCSQKNGFMLTIYLYHVMQKTLRNITKTRKSLNIHTSKNMNIQTKKM